MTVLVTGCAGFIGMHTCIALLREGHAVIGIDNINNYYSVELKHDRIKEIERCATEKVRNFEFFEEDIVGFDFNRITGSVDFVIHLAAQAGVRYSIINPKAYIHSNINAFQEIIDFVREAGVEGFIYASSSSVYGDSKRMPCSEEHFEQTKSFYAATKRFNEDVARLNFDLHAINSIGLRFFTVYGPWGRPDMAPFIFTKAAFSNKPVDIFNFGKQSRDFTYISDVVEGILSLVKSSLEGAHIFNIGRGKPESLTKFLNTIEMSTGKTLEKNFMIAQSGDVTDTWCSTQKLENITGYKPSISLAEGMDKFVAWYKFYYSC